MERSHFWGFMIVGLLFGLGLEFAKSPQGGVTGQGWVKNLKADFVADMFIPSGSSHRLQKAARLNLPTIKRIQARGGVAGLAEGQADAAAPDAAKAADAKKTDAKKTDTKKTDKKDDKKKDDKKKKKKKKKKKVDAKDDKKGATETETDDADEEDDGDSAAVNDAGAVPDAPAAGAGPVVANPDDIPQSLQEWENLILREPDFKATSMLIKFFHTGLVKDDIFFPVVQQMLEDSREKMQHLGVIALGSTPSVKSFSLLVHYADKSGNDAKLKVLAENYLRTYAEMHNMVVLEALLLRYREIQPAAQLRAFALVQKAAGQHLKQEDNKDPNATTPQPPDDPRQPSASSQTSPIRRQFDRLVNAIRGITQNALDGETRIEATETLQALELLLGQQSGGELTTPGIPENGIGANPAPAVPASVSSFGYEHGWR